MEMTHKKAVPDYGEGGGGAVGRGKLEQKPKNGNKCGRNEKSGCHKTVVNTCLSFLNGRKKRSGISL